MSNPVICLNDYNMIIICLNELFLNNILMPEIWSWEEKFGVDNSVGMCKKVFLVLMQTKPQNS